MKPSPSPKELGEEAQRLLASAPMTPREHIEFLIAHGIIDRQGRVLVNRLFGGEDETAKPAPAAPSTNGTADQSSDAQAGKNP